MKTAAAVAHPLSPFRLKAPRSRLFRKYALLIGFLVSSAPLVNGLVELYFSYQESKAALISSQRDKAQSAAKAIEVFLDGIEAQIAWTTHADFLPQNQAAIAQRRMDFARLLKQVPAITEIAYFDVLGREQLLVSRLSMDQFDRGTDYSQEPIFVESRAKSRFFSDVYFRRGSEPYLRIGIGVRGQRGGVTIAEINLKFIWDVVTQIGRSHTGNAFAVDARGLLIAHRDMSLVLQQTDFSRLPQVSSALSVHRDSPAAVARSREGLPVLSSHATIAATGWTVFVESPLSEAFAPLRGSIFRTFLLLMGGIVLAILASLFLTRRIVEPIRSLQLGAAEIGAGKLDHVIQVKSGDELEDLAEDFNRMTSKLRESYDHVERLSALKRYFSPHLAELIVSSTKTSFTDSHRRNITVVFCDLRNFTRFSASTEPEAVMSVLREYFDVLDRKLLEFEATIDHFAGDGLMAFFNDPVPCEKPSARAVRMAIEMQFEIGRLVESWRETGCELGFGIGIASGEATIGHIGSKDQFHYTAIGSCANLASRLCDEAQSGQILVCESVFAEVSSQVDAEPLGDRQLKGFPGPIPVISIIGWHESAPW